MPLSVVWLDQNQARLYHFSADRMERRVFRAPPSLHEQVATELERSKRILILGSDSDRARLLDFFRSSESALAERVIGSEILSEPSDPTIAAYARKYFGI